MTSCEVFDVITGKSKRPILTKLSSENMTLRLMVEEARLTQGSSFQVENNALATQQVQKQHFSKKAKREKCIATLKYLQENVITVKNQDTRKGTALLHDIQKGTRRK